MKKYLKNFWQLPKEKQMTVTVPSEEVFTCQLYLPMLPEKEVAEAVRWELPLHVPFEEGSFYYDYKLVGKSDGMQIVQVVAVLQEVVAKLEAEAQKQGLVLTEVSVAGFAEQSFNLLPDAAKRRRAPLTQVYKLGIKVSAILGIVLLAGAWCYKMVQTSRLQEVQSKLQTMRNWQERYENQEERSRKIQALSKAISKLEKTRLLWSEVLLTLESNMPAQCWLITVKQKEASQTVEVQGKAASMLQIKKLLENLQGSKKFTSVSLAETGRAKGELLSYKLLLTGEGEGK